MTSQHASDPVWLPGIEGLVGAEGEVENPQGVGATGFRGLAGFQAVDPVVLNVHHAVLNAVPRLGCPRMLGDDELFFVDSGGGDHLHVVVRTQGDSPVGSFDGHECLRVRAVIGGGFVTRIDDARGAGKAENDGGYVLALDLRVDPDRFSEQAIRLTEEEAIAAGHEVTIFESTFRPLKHTVSGSEERTMMKLVVDADSDRVLGAHMVGADAGEICQGLGIALKMGATKADFDRTVGIHPTAAEEFVTMRTPRD